MEIFIPLMVAAIQSAGPVLGSFVSKAKDVADKHIFDKKFVENAIIDSSKQLAELIKVASLGLKQELIEQSIIDVVQELQAHVASIRDLLSLIKTSEITPAMAERLITGGLLPLQVSLKKAELRLTQYEREDLRLFCHVAGTNALIAGYAFAGQGVSTLQKDLEDSIYVFQKRLLDSIAKSNGEIPWNKVPHLLTTEGISDLYELYVSSAKVAEKAYLSDDKKETESKEVTQTARIMQDPFIFSVFVCSECGHKGISRKATIYPNCNRKFV
ncbi:MAG: hypothetical protein HND47_20675 [Chloroflexi bacterium]|nr:hypothetical protein [Chloroflexota bacterium]